MNRTKDTIDLAYEELERAIAEAEGYQSDDLSEAEAVGRLLEEMLGFYLSFFLLSRSCCRINTTGRDNAKSLGYSTL